MKPEACLLIPLEKK